MPDYLMLMHKPAALPATPPSPDTWPAYLAQLRATGGFQGGSEIGGGLCMNKSSQPAGITGTLIGYIRVHAGSLAEAQALVHGNPVFEAGGTVEIRELPVSS